MGEDADAAATDVRAPTPLDRLVAWLGPPRSYVLTRNLIVRLLGIIYVFAFLGLLFQGLPLLGHHGLTPIDVYVADLRGGGATFWDVPSVFLFDASDASLMTWAAIGFALAAFVAAGYANIPMLVALWLIYGSYERVGQAWFSFGWEIQLLETTLLVAAMVHPIDPRARQPPALSLVLMRWLAFRIMLGAGLIKLRGDACWHDLTCLDTHFETQPLPNPLSPLLHHAPHAVHAIGVAMNHAVELVAPWLVFGPRLLRLVAGCAMLAFQLALIASGNLAFLNWLTIVPLLACLDDDFLRRLIPARWRPPAEMAAVVAIPGATPGATPGPVLVAFGVTLVAVLVWTPIFGGRSADLQVALGAALVIAALVATGRSPWPISRQHAAVAMFAALVAVKSCDVVENLASDHQAMNRSYDALALVNTYGAFGSIDKVRHELIVEGTLDEDPVSFPARAVWRAYEFPCKPGDLARRPCVLGPYHRRLDWVIWFAAMRDEIGDAWVLHLVYKLLDGDREIRKLVEDPFDGVAPRWVRIRRFVYHLEPYGEDAWWSRDHEELWLAPIARNNPELMRILAQYGWPSPSLR